MNRHRAAGQRRRVLTPMRLGVLAVTLATLATMLGAVALARQVARDITPTVITCVEGSQP